LEADQWLFTQRGQGVTQGYQEQIQIAVGRRVEDFNQGPLDFKSSALNHSATLPPHVFPSITHSVS